MTNVHHLSAEARRVLDDLIKRRGHFAAARVLRVADSTIDRALGPGLQKATLERLEQRLAEQAEKAKAVANG